MATIKDVAQATRVGERQGGAFVVHETAFEVKNQGVIGDDGVLAVLVDAFGQHFLHFSSSLFFQGQDLVVSEKAQVHVIVFSGEVEFVQDFLVLVKFHNIRQYPARHVNTIGDGFNTQRGMSIPLVTALNLTFSPAMS